VQFFDAVKDMPILELDSSMPPVVGCIVVIRKEQWRVASVNWAVDYADQLSSRQMRCAVNLVKL
jgi:hypothetical protein